MSLVGMSVMGLLAVGTAAAVKINSRVSVVLGVIALIVWSALLLV